MTLGNDNGTDGQTDRRTDRRTDRVRRNMRPPPREEGRITSEVTIIAFYGMLFMRERLVSVIVIFVLLCTF